MSDTTLQAPSDVRIDTNGNGKSDPDAWRAQLEAEVAEAEKDLARDKKALDAAIAKVDALKADVEFDQMRAISRAKGLATFDQLRAKAKK